MTIIRIADEATGSFARIAPELGFNCFEFRARVTENDTVDVLEAEDGFESGDRRLNWNGIPLLFPFPNRIRAGRFTWDGVDYHLSSDRVGDDGAGNAIHGFCLDRAWRVVEHTPDSVTGEFQFSVDAPDRASLWPADAVIRVSYTVASAALHCRIVVRNPDTRPLPWGFGTHAYFRLPLSPNSSAGRCLLQADASEQWKLTDCLPTGDKSPVGPGTDLRDGDWFDTLNLDDVLSGLIANGEMHRTSILDESAGLVIHQDFDQSFRELVVFTPPGRDAVCMEPYTCVTDAINLEQQGIDSGLRVLDPGGEVSLMISISADRILV